MPISGNWNNATKTLVLEYSGYFTVRKEANKIFMDKEAVIDTSTNPWGVTHVADTQIGTLTGNPAAKKQDLIDMVNLNAFTSTVPIADLGADDPDKTVDPDLPTQYWGDADGVKNPAGLFYVSKAVEITGFDDTLLAADDLSGISVRRIS